MSRADGNELNESQERAVRAFASYVARCEAGSAPDFELWVREHAAEESALREMHSAWRVMFPGGAEAGAGLLFAGSRRAPARAGRAGAGRTFGDFTLLSELGEGGMGTVWEAEQRSIHRHVALKLLHPHLELSQRARQRFHREAEAQGRINHPNIVAVHTVGEQDGQHYLVQELVQGGCTLASFIDAQHGPAADLPEGYHEHLARFMIRILEALQCAHDAGVVHRDLKPLNILITSDDQPKVTDFGLARVLDAEPLSRPGEVAGTFSYMSPEQASGEHETVDPRTDVFSLGATFYEVLTFERAFQGDTTHEICNRILYVDPPDARKIRPDTPRDLAVICAKALEKHPDHRFQSMEEFAAELRRYLADEPILSRPAGPLRRTSKWMRRHPTTTAVLAVVVLALGLTYFLVETNRAERRSSAYEREILHAQMAADAGDLVGAELRVDSAQALLPEDYTGDLILAAAHARQGLAKEANRYIEDARARGFHEDLIDSALENYAQGQFCLAGRRLPEAERHLVRALELDSNLSAAYLALYMARIQMKDMAGAREALADYRSRMRVGEKHLQLVDAQILELEGRYDEALAELDAFAARTDIDKHLLLLCYGHQGRILCLARHFERADAVLTRAVELYPEYSGGMRENLALANLWLARLGPAEERLARMQATLRIADEALQLDAAIQRKGPSSLLQEVRALALLYGLEVSTAAPGDVFEEALNAAEDAARELEKIAPENARLTEIDSKCVYWQGRRHEKLGDKRRARLLYEEALAIDTENLLARVRLGTRLFFDRDHAGALQQFERARQTWERSSEREASSATGEPWPRHWYQVLNVWAFGAACNAGQVDAAWLAREAVEVELEANEEFDPIELLNYAEFLGTSPLPELKNCPRALQLIEEGDLRRVFGQHAEGAQILALIDKACK